MERASQIFSEGLEQLRISELLLEEALAKQQRSEIMESLELRGEALAYEREALALLNVAIDEHRKSISQQSRTAGRQG
jgi:hypothetical protein